MKSISSILKKFKTTLPLLATLMLLASLLLPAAVSAQELTVFAPGPVIPVDGFPTPNGWPAYYQDINGVRLELLPIGPENLADPPTAGDDYGEALGFGAEAFYYVVEGGGEVGGLVEFALEAVWDNLNEAPVPGDEAMMNRVRIRLDAGVIGGSGDYNIVTPFGEFAFPGVIDDPISTRDINFTQDILGLGQDFVTVTTGPVNEFWFPTTTTAITPGGLLGDGATAGPATIGLGGPSATVTIEGPGGNIELTSWVIGGRFSAFQDFAASFTAAPAAGPAPLAVQFTDTSVGVSPTTTWAWDFGDGATSANQSPTHTFSPDGVYTVTLTITDPSRAPQPTASAPFTRTITVNSNPPAAPVLTTTPVSPTAVTFTWTAPAAGDAVTGYVLQHSNNNTFPAANIHIHNLPAGTLSFAHPFSEEEAKQTPNFFRVVALNSTVQSAPSASVQAILLADAPASPSATAPSATQVIVTWTNPATANQIRIERRTGTTGNFTAVETVNVTANVTVQQFADNTVVQGTTYQYQLIAVNGSGDSATAAGPVTVTTPAPPPPPISVNIGAGGGGGGGGGAPPTATVSLTGLSGAGPVVDASTGITQAAAKLATEDNKVSIDIASGTTMRTASGAAVTSLSVAAAAPPAQPPQAAVVLNYNFGPDGAVFTPALTITLAYTDAALPAGTVEADLYAAWWDGSKWVKLESTVNTQTNTITAKVTHFTNVAVIAPTPAPAPAAAPAPTPAPTPSPEPAPAANPAPAPLPVPVPVPTPTTLAITPTPTPATPATPAAPAAPAPAPEAAPAANPSLLIGIIGAAVILVGLAILIWRKKSAS